MANLKRATNAHAVLNSKCIQIGNREMHPDRLNKADIILVIILYIGLCDLTVTSTVVNARHGSKTPGDVVLLLADIQTSYISKWSTCGQRLVEVAGNSF